MLAAKYAALEDWKEFQQRRQCVLLPLIKIKDLVQLSLAYLEGNDPFYWFEEHLYLYLSKYPEPVPNPLSLHDPFITRYISNVVRRRRKVDPSAVWLSDIEIIELHMTLVDECNRFDCYYVDRDNNCICDRPIRFRKRS